MQLLRAPADRLSFFATAAMTVAALGLTATEAAAGTTDIDFGDVACTLRVDTPHFSTGYNDVSVHSTTFCFSKAGPRPRYTADRIEMTTSIDVFKPDRMSGGRVVSCGPTGMSSRYSFELPCHGRWAGAGRYGAHTTASVTVKGVTRSAEAGNSAQIDGDPSPA